jgi:hypothetical protein
MSPVQPLKQQFRAGLEKSLNLIGLEAFIRTKSQKFDWLSFDKKMLSRYFRSGDPRVTLYQEGLIKTKMESTDNFSKEQRFFILQQIVQQTIKNNILGDYVECGCWRGHSTYIIAKLLQRAGFKGTFHVFDSFEGGLSDKTNKDKNLRQELTQQENLQEKLYFASTFEEVGNNLKEFPFVKLYKGWVPDRFPEVKDKNFAFVHVDVDLYQPTKDSLEFFYPRLKESGGIVVDDYGLSQFDGCQAAVDELLKELRPKLFLEEPLGGCVIIK